MKQAAWKKDWSGCKGTSEFDGHNIAIEAWGEKAQQCGLTSFPYLWRRFGPPFTGSDDYKSIADYHLTTKNPDVHLWVTCTPGRLCYQVGAIWSKELHERISEPVAEWHRKAEGYWLGKHYPDFDGEKATQEMCEQYGAWLWGGMSDEDRANLPRIPRATYKDWQSQTGPVHELNQAVFDALKELERPVYVRDQYFNIFGECEPSDSAKYSKYAGYGIPRKPMLKLLEKK